MMDETMTERPAPGIAMNLGDGLRRVLAPNPSPMTGWGTNSYIVGTGDVAIIDPGPDDAGHLSALVAALAPGERVSHIFVTHAHRDHSAGAAALARATGAPVLAFGEARAGRSPLMEDLARRDPRGAGEGADLSFRPDRTLRDGEEVAHGTWRLRALHTPGHFGNHLCFIAGDAVLSGDHVMGWSTSIVAPPDGDMGAYMASLDRLEAVGARRLWPGHGAPVTNPAARIAELRHHRQERAAAIAALLDTGGPATAPDLARFIYTDTPPALLGAAAQNVFAHLLEMMVAGRVTPEAPPTIETRFRLLPAQGRQ